MGTFFKNLNSNFCENWLVHRIPSGNPESSRSETGAKSSGTFPRVKSTLQRRAHVDEGSHPGRHLLFVSKERPLEASAFCGSVVKFIGRWIQERLYLDLKSIITY